jgi:hypothetical protein
MDTKQVKRIADKEVKAHEKRLHKGVKGMKKGGPTSEDRMRAERHRAKEAGFRWNDPVAGAWSRRLSDREALALPFPVQPVEAA